MYAYVQIVDKNNQSHEDTFNLTVQEDRSMALNYIGGSIKSSFNIPCTEMQNLAIDHWYGSQQISFNYGGCKFIFIENGYGEIDYLKKHLLQQSAA